jgi:CubicO group peptidase (beta-lactamase class C family)
MRPWIMQIDEPAVDAAAAASGFTGVVAIDAGDERVFERCYGFAHRALAVPNTPGTRFGLASGSKTFTALAVLRLVEQGRLRLTDPVRPILGDDLPLIDGAVTIEHLLTHTSGIGDYLDEEADWKPDDYVLTVPVHVLAETSAFLPMLEGQPQKFPPGERFGYCNQGFMVLALVIERVAGTGFHEFVETEVFARAALAHTGFLRSDDLPGDAALGYFEKAGNHTNVLHLPVRGNGDGGAFTTVSDLHLFWRAVLAGRIVGPDLVAELTRPRNDVPEEGMRYAAGVWLHATGPQLIMAGYDAGVAARSVHDPASSTTATVLSNSSRGAGAVVDVVQGFFD